MSIRLQPEMKATPIRETKYTPVPLQPGDVTYAGYRTDLDACVFWVRPGVSMTPAEAARRIHAAVQERPMNNARNNKTTQERDRECLQDVYTLGADLVDEHGHPSRFWFMEESDRQAFLDTFNAVRDGWARIA